MNLCSPPPFFERKFSMREIYLDNSATTALSPAVKARMTQVMDCYGNPSSLHTPGNLAHDILETARRQVGEAFGVRRPETGEILFTSCGSESDNLAILGCAYAKPRRRWSDGIRTRWQLFRPNQRSRCPRSAQSPPHLPYSPSFCGSC